MSVRDDVEAVRQGLILLELAPITSRVINGLIETVGAKKLELENQVALNTELQKAIGKERDQVERMRRALQVLNARFHSVCNSVGPHISALYLEDLAEVRAILGEPPSEPK